MSNRAWVTLATNDSYGLGALVLAHSLRRANSQYPAVILVTPSVSEAMRSRLSAVFAEVITVDVLDSRDATHLALLQRPELGITFTKIHCWSLTQYQKCVFLDADTLIVQNCDELFEREELSAAPDVGWPDCFNSGVFVFVPSSDTYARLIAFAQERGSFDGGDQGLLNAFFSDWAHGDISKHLPFLYNVTSAAFYSYIPALKHYGQDLKIIHFIGAAKPWLQQFNWDTCSVDAPEHLRQYLQSWWDIFVGQVHSQLDSTMDSPVEEHEVLSTTTPEVVPEDIQHHYEPAVDPKSEFPWHHPEPQTHETGDNFQPVDLSNVYDPWEHLRGSIPPLKNFSLKEYSNFTDAKIQEIIRKYAWAYQGPHQDSTHPVEDLKHESFWQYFNEHLTQHENIHHHTQNQESQHFKWEDHSHNQRLEHESNKQHEHYHLSSHPQQMQLQQERYQQMHNTDHHNRKNAESHFYQHNHDHFNQNLQINTEINETYKQSLHSHEQHESEPHDTTHTHTNTHNFSHRSNFHESTFNHFNPYTAHQPEEQVYYVHFDHRRRIRKRAKHIHVCSRETNGLNISDTDSEDDFIIPRHPYDGFYLRHKMTIDARGRKICIHEIPPTPSPSPPESVHDERASPTPTEDFDTASECEDLDSGVAGNLARVSPGEGGYQREAIDELTRRQGWEAGNIDYLGADSFDNIWAKISQTLNQPRASPPKEPSPPRKEPTPPKDQPQLEAIPAAIQASASEVAPEASVTEVPVPEEPASATPVIPVAEAEVKPIEVPVTTAAPDVASNTEAPAVSAEAPAIITPSAAPVESPAQVSAPTETAEVPKETSAAQEVPTEASSVPVETSIESAVCPVAPAEAAAVPTEATEVAVETASVSAEAPTPESAPQVETTPTPVDVPTTVVEALASEPAPEVPAKEKTESVVTAAPEVPPVPAEAAVQVEKIPEAPSEAPQVEPTTPEKAQDSEAAAVPASDSPPLANTPSKEEAPAVPAAKSEERRKPAGKLQLQPPAAADALPTPDSELEDAATLAQSIINSELAAASPLHVTAPSPSADADAPSPPHTLEEKRLSVEPPEVPTPPVSLAQIGVKSKGKPSTASQIESSVTETEAAVSPPTQPAPSTPSPGESAKQTVEAAVPATPTSTPVEPGSPAAGASESAPALTQPEAPPTPTSPAPSESAPALKQPEAPPTPTSPAPSESAPALTQPAAPPTPTSPVPSDSATALSDAPKKKVVKKGAKKEAAAGSEVPTPVPPPRKKEKKPKEK